MAAGICLEPVEHDQHRRSRSRCIGRQQGAGCLYLIHLRAGSDPRRTGHLFRRQGRSACLCARYRSPLGKQGGRINAVAPGNILFDGSVWSRKLAEDTPGVQAMLSKDVALGSLGTPDDVASLVAYLASPRSGFATGGVWTLDGGQVHA